LEKSKMTRSGQVYAFELHISDTNQTLKMPFFVYAKASGWEVLKWKTSENLSELKEELLFEAEKYAERNLNLKSEKNTKTNQTKANQKYPSPKNNNSNKSHSQKKKNIEYREEKTPNSLETRKNSLENKIVIDRAEFEKFGFATAGEILRTQPGVFMEDPSENDKISLRGAPYAYTQVLVDGQRMPDGDEQRAFSVDRIPAGIIERIEIIRSPSANTDAQGIAGTINIIIKKSNNTTRNELITSYGYNQTKGNVYNASLITTKTKKRWNTNLKVTYQKRINGKDKDKNEIATDKNNKFEQDYRDIAYTEFALAPTFSYQVKKNSKLSISPLVLYSQGLGSRKKQGEEVFKDTITGDSSVVNGREKEITKRNRQNVHLRANHNWKVSKRLNMDANGMTGYSQTFTDITKTKVFDDAIFNTENQTINTSRDLESSARLNATYTVSSHWKINASAESQVKNRTINRERRLNGFEERVNIEDLYKITERRINLVLNNQLKIFILHANFGLRMESLRGENSTDTWYITNFNRIRTTITKESSSRNIDPFLNFNFHLNPKNFTNIILKTTQKFFLRKTPLDSLKKKIIPKTGDFRIKPNVTRTVKRPKFSDLNPFIEYNDGTWLNPDKGGNPNLKPETAYGLDLAIEYYPAGKRGVLGVNFYRRYLTNMVAQGIELDPFSYRFTQRPINIGTGIMQGFELDFRYSLLKNKNNHLDIRGNYTQPKSKVKDPKSGNVKPFNNQPTFFYNIGVDYTAKRLKDFTIGGNYNHYPGFRRTNVKQDGSFESVEQLPLFKTDVFIGYRAFKNLHIRLSAQAFLISQKRKDEFKENSLGEVRTKMDRELYRPTYMVTANYKF
ncbi:MAG: TonB-dependent receptor, partial [Cytophagales bacterium]